MNVPNKVIVPKRGDLGAFEHSACHSKLTFSGTVVELSEIGCSQQVDGTFNASETFKNLQTSTQGVQEKLKVRDKMHFISF